ncbi:MAG: hypothetical protein HY081_00680 [Gammaproteobacteria bacterium]|nr:hypothetical protein [Gammaproteobacteria bacterium]
MGRTIYANASQSKRHGTHIDRFTDYLLAAFGATQTRAGAQFHLNIVSKTSALLRTLQTNLDTGSAEALLELGIAAHKVRMRLAQRRAIEQQPHLHGIALQGDGIKM